MTSSFSQPVVCPVTIGRDEAIARLRGLRVQAMERGRVGLVSGEAGIGKSRVVAESLREAALEGWRTFVIRFFEQDANLPYSGIVRLMGDIASSPDASALDEGLIRDLGLVSPEFAAMDHRQGDAATKGSGEGSDKLQFLQAMSRLVRLMASKSPVVLAFEDLHWADASSLEALLRIARDANPGRLLVMTYRDDERSAGLDTMLGELDRERLSAEVRLTGLRLTDVDQMLRACLGSERSTRADVLHTIHQLTDGNPFFVEELTRSILDKAGDLESLDATRLADFDLPRGVNEAVRRRTEALQPSERRVLSLAAVAGVRFDFDLLVELSGLGEHELLDAIKALIAAQLVVEERGDEFAFRHALTREAVRSEMLHRERRALSQRVGEALERMHDGELESWSEDLERHFFEAEDWERALRYSRIAGERALGLYTPGAALVHLTRALEAGVHLQRTDLAGTYRLRGAANEAIGDFEAARADYETAANDANADATTRWRALLDIGLLWASRDYSKSEPYYRAALEMAEQMGDRSAVAHSLNRLGNWYSNTGDVSRARELGEQALATFREAGDAPGVAQTLDLLGMSYTQGMHFGQAAVYYREAIPLLEQIDDRRTLASALASIQIGSSTIQSDMMAPGLTLKEGSSFGERALVIAREMGWRSAESYALWQLSFALAPQGEYARALACAEESLAIAREIGHTQWETAAECALGAVLTDVFAIDQALLHLDRALSLAHEMESAMWKNQATALRIDALLAARRTDEALRAFRSVATQSALGFGERQLYASGAAAELAAGNLETARDMLNRLEAASERTEPDKPALRLLRLRGKLHLASGDLDAAADCLQQAEATALRHGHLSHAWRNAADLAHALTARGDRSGARAAADRALALLDQLGDRVTEGELRQQYVSAASEALPGALRRRQTTRSANLLTSREEEIAAMVARGLTNREIGERFVLSSRTIETHVANAMAKLGFTSRSQLAAWVVEHGLTSGSTEKLSKPP